MLRFAIGRLALAAGVALTVSVISFALLHMSGDLATALSGQSASADDVAKLRHSLGLDQPIHLQYLEWLWRALTGDFGKSAFTGEPVGTMIRQHFPVTAVLGGGATLIAFVFGILLGVTAAIRPNGWLDRGAQFIAVCGQGMPVFWLALMLVYWLGVELRWLPISGSETPAHFILPIVSLALVILPGFMRLTRSGMLNALESDYVKTARAKGLRLGAILWFHALPNAILPVISLTAVTLGFVLGGTVILEAIFALNGIGFLAFHSITRNDFPVVQAIVLIVSLIYILLTTCADLLNAWLDPRLARQ